MINIGQKIREVVEKRGMAKTQLARRMNMTSSNIHKIFNRKTIDTGLLAKLSLVLDYNFFSHYPENIKGAEKAGDPESKSYYDSLKRNFESKIEGLTREINYLREINDMLREKLKSAGR